MPLHRASLMRRENGWRAPVRHREHPPTSHPGRRIEILANGRLLWHSAQAAVDTADRVAGQYALSTRSDAGSHGSGPAHNAPGLTSLCSCPSQGKCMALKAPTTGWTTRATTTSSRTAREARYSLAQHGALWRASGTRSSDAARRSRPGLP